jgi:hypothetical protein
MVLVAFQRLGSCGIDFEEDESAHLIDVADELRLWG